MSGTDDYIDEDPFDPEVIKRTEEYEARQVAVSDEEIKAYVSRRKLAYTAVFDGKGTPGDVEIVMLDLARFCRAYTPTFHPTNAKVQDMLEGRREVFQRILSYTRLTQEQLYVKFIVDAQKGKQ
jgi:hypothetical protein